MIDLQMEVNKMQYKIIEISARTYEQIEGELNRIANEGWELVTMTIMDVGGKTVTVWKKK